MSAEIKAHIRKTLRRPKRLEETRARLDKELKAVFKKTKLGTIPRHKEDRARFLFDELGIEPLVQEHRDGLTLRQLEQYKTKSELVSKLAEFERASRGGFTMHTRGSYNKFKQGNKRHRWVRAVRFKI